MSDTIEGMESLRKKNTSKEVPAKDQKKLVTMIRSYIRSIGRWTGDEGNGVHWLAKIAISLYVINQFAQYVAMFLVKGEPDKLFECISLTTFFTIGGIKMYSLRNNDWKKLLSRVEALENEQLNEADELNDNIADVEDSEVRFTAYFQSYTDRYKSAVKLLCRIYYGTLIIFNISFLIRYGVWKLQTNKPGYPHLMLSWSPLEKFNVALGESFSVISEIVGCVYCVITHTVYDLIVVGMVVFVCGQFSWLRDYSESIGGNGQNLTFSKQRDDRAHYKIIRCHRVHNLLINIITDLDNLIRNTLGVYISVVTLTLCTIAVRLVSEKHSGMDLVSLMQYMCGMLTQLFLFCYYGSEILHGCSVGMGEGPFGAAYWALSPRSRRELLLLSYGMAQPRRLWAGPFIFLNLKSFIQIINTAYSYYTLMRK